MRKSSRCNPRISQPALHVVRSRILGHKHLRLSVTASRIGNASRRFQPCIHKHYTKKDTPEASAYSSTARSICPWSASKSAIAGKANMTGCEDSSC